MKKISIFGIVVGVVLLPAYLALLLGFTATESPVEGISREITEKLSPDSLAVAGMALSAVVVLVSLLRLGGEASSISDVIRALGHRRVTSALRNAYGKVVGRLEDKGLVETERVRKRKVVRLTRFGRIMAEALTEAGD